MLELKIPPVAVTLIFAGLMTGTAFATPSQTNVPPSQPTTLIATTGPYRWTRNPMYLGFFTMLLGLGLILGNWCAMVAGLFFVPYMNRFQIAPEERVLAGLFGSDFDAFRRDVRRWL